MHVISSIIYLCISYILRGSRAIFLGRAIRHCQNPTLIVPMGVKRHSGEGAEWDSIKAQQAGCQLQSLMVNDDGERRKVGSERIATIVAVSDSDLCT